MGEFNGLCCPFCGAEPILELDDEGFYWLNIAHKKGCFMEPYDKISFESKQDEEFVAWNTRFKRQCRLREIKRDVYLCTVCGHAVVNPMFTWNNCPFCASEIEEWIELDEED